MFGFKCLLSSSSLFSLDMRSFLRTNKMFQVLTGLGNEREKEKSKKKEGQFAVNSVSDSFEKQFLNVNWTTSAPKYTPINTF